MATHKISDLIQAKKDADKAVVALNTAQATQATASATLKAALAKVGPTEITDPDGTMEAWEPDNTDLGFHMTKLGTGDAVFDDGAEVGPTEPTTEPGTSPSSTTIPFTLAVPSPPPLPV